MHLLEMKGIHKSYRRGGLFGARDRFEVLKNVHLAIEPGICLGLLGRSGSGKSTLGRIALGLEPPDAGEVLYCGRPLRSLKGGEYREFRKNLQVVFQNSLGSVNPRLTAGEIVSEPLRNFERLPTRQLRIIAGGLLEQVGLSAEDSAKYPHQFSGGELQRVCIARAIALKPRLIVLDEAVSSLDMLIQTRILDLLTTLQKELGIAYLFISHDIRVLLRMAHRLAVMHDGIIVDQAESIDDVGHLTHHAFSHLIDAILPPLPTG